MANPILLRYAWLSVAAALVTLALKLAAWRLTGSVSVLADALESLVNLGAAAMAVAMLRIAAQPPDAGHPYGHGKSEYFSSGLEGLLVMIAGVAILAPAVLRLLAPRPVDAPLAGVLVGGIAALVNLGVARALLGAGARHDSVALRADGAHLMTDVWTSVGVIAGLLLVSATGWHVLDPLVALAVALHILRTGWRLLAEAVAGLMDAAWPAQDLAALDEVLAAFRSADVEFHAVRTRRAGARRFASFHVLVPGAWTVQRGHDLVERIEDALAARVPHVAASIHMEPLEDAASYADDLDRPPP